MRLLQTLPTRSAKHLAMLPLVCGVLVAIAAPTIAAPLVHCDDAARYSSERTDPDRWLNKAHRGDLAFGTWIFESDRHGGSAGRLIKKSHAGGGVIDTDEKSFALFAFPPGSPPPLSAIIRTFAKPALTTGDAISFQLAVDLQSGNKGFSMRNTQCTELFNFNVGRNDGSNDGYYIRNGIPPDEAHDDGRRLGAYDANTVFAFTFTQREREVDWSIERSGGITGSLAGSFPADSGTVADIRFYTSGTEDSKLHPANNLYFYKFVFTPANRGDAPLTIGERRLPGLVPSHLLRFTDPKANSVILRSRKHEFPLSKDKDGVWSLAIQDIFPPGWHSFNFVINGEPEAGSSRHIYVDKEGRLAKPPAVYLTWQRDPSRTMTVHWYNDDPASNSLRCRTPGSPSWKTLKASTDPFPHTARHIHTAEITGLKPASTYEFEVDGYSEVFQFRTMPTTLDNGPVVFAIGGDVDIGPIPDALTAAAAAHNPDFLVIGGDHAYEDARAGEFWRWYRYMESWFHNARTPDGRLIPLVVGIGNHEVLHGYSSNHPDFDDTPAWRDRYGAYYYRSFPFPGPATPYAALDFGDYLSFLIMDTEHSSPVITGEDRQTLWLAAALDERRHVPHLFPIHHVPAWPSARPVDDPVSLRIRQHWVPLYENTGVEIVFENHDHTFKRTKPLRGGEVHPQGIRYIGDGLWGRGNRQPDTTRPFIETANDVHHVHIVTLTPEGRSIEALDKEGNFFGGRLEQPTQR